MSDEITFAQNEDGTFSAYDDTYDDITIHCETEEEQKKVIERLKSISWIPVTERLPEEHDSIFAKLKGTADWDSGMFEKVSRYVLVTVKYKDGIMRVHRARTADGEWRTEISLLGREVIAWMPFPEPYKED